MENPYIKSPEQIVEVLWYFYKYRYYLPPTVLKNLYFALIYPSIQYGIEIFANTKFSYLEDLKILNNRVLRILQFGNLRTHLHDLYTRYNTLPVHLLHNYKLCLLVFQYLKSNALLPDSFRNYFTMNFAVHTHFTRTSADIHLHRYLTSFGKRALHYRAAVLWNSLPAHIKGLQLLTSFKKVLYNYYSETMAFS